MPRTASVSPTACVNALAFSRAEAICSRHPKYTDCHIFTLCLMWVVVFVVQLMLNYNTFKRLKDYFFLDFLDEHSSRSMYSSVEFLSVDFEC